MVAEPFSRTLFIGFLNYNIAQFICQTKVAKSARLFYNIVMKCNCCPVACGADRDKTNGACGVGGLKIAKYYLHPFEEPPISFQKGSGTVFFCGCSLKCVFCQNYELSRNTRGKIITERELADIFRELEEAGADNINLVNPTHYLRHIMGAMEIYKPNIPVVYNTHGYETVENLKLASEFADIFLPDLKFMDKALAKRYTARGDYPDYALPAIRFMAQKPLEFSPEGKMLTGCIVRHLILPLAAYDSVNAVRFFASLDGEPYLSLMSQYTPCGEIENHKELQRPITKREYERVLAEVETQHITRVFLQERTSAQTDFIPHWDY